MKKKWKKLIGIMLGLVMVLGMSATTIPVNATTTTDTTANKIVGTYEVFQIFTGDFYQEEGKDAVLSNVKWGQNAADGYTTGEAVDEKILTIIEGLKTLSEAEQAAALSDYVNFDSDPIATVDSGTASQNDNITIEKGAITVSGLDSGYYLVRNQPNSVTGAASYTLYVVKVVNDTLTIVPKNDIPTAEKKILDDTDENGTDEEVDRNEASIGETITYQITGTLPENFDAYNTYYYLFTDTLSKGLTYTDNLTVKIVNSDDTEGGKDVTGYFWVNETENDDESTTLKVGISDLVQLNNLTDVTVDANSKIILTYTAELNENAVIGGKDGNPNEVVLEYSNDPNNSGDGKKTENPSENPEEPKTDHPTGETPESQVTTYTTEFAVLKIDENGNILTDVEFTLSSEDGSIAAKVTVTEKFEKDNNGNYWKLKNGSYTLTAPTMSGEGMDSVEAVEGNENDYDDITQKYSKTSTVTVEDFKENDSKEITVTVDKTGRAVFTGLGAGEYTLTETQTPDGYNTIDPINFKINFNNGIFSSDNDDITVGANNTLQTTIVNMTGTILPSTGGIGTTIFYVVGMVIIIAACVLLITRRRAKK